jgi:hypothetical protein
MSLRVSFAASIAALLACLVWPALAQDKTSPKKPLVAPEKAPQDSAAAKAVRQAHDSLTRWLGSDENAANWKSYLMSDELTGQLQRGRKADRQVVKAIVAKYSGNTPGLSLVPFAAVRDALRAWQTELATPTADDLPQAARDAKTDFRPPTAQEVARAKTSTQRALDALETFVGSSSGWRTVLKLDDLHAELKKPQPEPDVLAEVLRRFTRDYRGLEMRQFTAVRDSLADYLWKVRIAQDAKAEATYKEQLDSLADALTAYRASQKLSDLEKAARAIRWLEDRGQAPLMTKVARQTYWKPNVYVEISAPVVVYGFEEKIDETEPINEYRNNAQVVGSSRTVGPTVAKLKPFDRVGVIHNEFEGATYSRSTAYASQATVYSRATTTIHAIKQISIDRNGFHDYPTTAAASTQSYTEGIDSAYASQASQRVEASRPENNDRASRKAENNIRERLDRETRKQLDEANADYYRQFVNPLTKYDAFPGELHFSTTGDALVVKGTQAMGALLAATGEPPPSPEKRDLVRRTHQSWMNNTAWAMYAGRTVPEEEFRKELTDVLGREPKRLKRTNENPPWTITFEADSPISVQLGQGTVLVSLHGTSFKSGKSRAQDIPMNVTASYTVAKDDKGPKYVRQGKLQVFPPDVVAKFDKDGDGFLNRDEEDALNKSGTQLTAGQSSLRGQLEDDFANLFEPEIRPEPQTLSGRWKSLGQLKPDYLAISPGWMTIGYMIDKGPAKEPAKEGAKTAAKR